MSTAALFTLLNASLFFNSGLITSNDTYLFQPIDCLYLEPENVTLATDVWAQSTRIGVPQPGPCQYLYQLNGTLPPPASCSASTITPGYDRMGSDYSATVETLETCQTLCCNATDQCQAWVWVPAAPGPFLDCTDTTQPCCYLKNASPTPTKSNVPGIISGSPPSPPSLPVVAPPTGMRSSVPLGGLGTGTFELRGDGTFHEWTIHQASPAGSAKFGVVGDMMLGIQVVPASGTITNAITKALRTNSVDSAAGTVEGVDAITYSGSFPLSRLQIQDNDIQSLIANPTLYAYSRLVPGNVNATATPAVTFSLTATNPSDQPVNMTLFLSLPLSSQIDFWGTMGNTTKIVQTSNASQCLQACSNEIEEICASWVWDNSNQDCTMQSGTALFGYRPGFTTGARGRWSITDNQTLTLNQGTVNVCSQLNPSPLCGNYGVRAVPDTRTSSSFGTGDSLADLWTQVLTNGKLNGLPNNDIANSIGAATATVTLDPHESRSVSLVFAWYLPNKDYKGVTVGAYYGNLYPSSSAVLDDIANTATQQAIVTALNSHHQVWGNSSEPDWLIDVTINSFSHMRNAIHLKDGRWRQWEAFDCDDIDSVHNDFQRHLPYLWLFPEFEVQKSRIWGAFADKTNGNIQEVLAVGCLGTPSDLDVPGGRLMGDVTTIWTLGVYELYQNMALGSPSATMDYLTEIYPVVQNALRWQLDQCNHPEAPGLPYALVCTYDIEELEKFPTTTYNSFLHLAMMQAVMKLANVMNDTTTYQTALNGYTTGLTGIHQQLWNSSAGCFRAYSQVDELPIMADCLYGIQISTSLGLGPLWDGPSTDLLSHLSMEINRNLDAYGLQVLSGRGGPMPFAGIDTTHWGMGGPTYSSVSLFAGERNLTVALEPSKRFMDNYRSRLADQWNLAGLTTSGNWTFHENENGMSWCTSHYGMPLTHYYIQYGISQQQVNLMEGKLSFAPVMDPPYTVPVLLAGTTGTVSRDSNGNISVYVAFGGLTLPAGGLSVDGSVYPNSVNLSAGQSLTWNTNQ